MKEQKNVPELRFPGFEGEWERKKIVDELIESKLGGNYSNSDTPTQNPLIKMGNLERGVINIDKLQFIEEGEELNETDLIKRGDLFFNTRNTLELVGKVAIWKEELPRAFYNSNLLRMTFPNNYFMNYRFNSRKGITGLRRLATGTTSVAAIYNKDLFNLKLYLPTLPEQEKIADFLSAVDDKIAQLTRKVALLEAYKKGVMQAIFRQEIRFRPDGSVGPAAQGEGQSFPDWEVKRLGEIAKNINYGINAAAKEFDGEWKYLRITDIDESSNQFIPSPLTSPNATVNPKYLLRKGDLVFARTGASVGKTYLYNPQDGKLVYAGFLIKISIIHGNPHFVFLNTVSRKYRRWVKAMSMRSGQPGLNAEEIKSFKIPFPDKEEQDKISSFFTSLEQQISHYKTLLTSTQAFKKGLLQRLFV